MKARVLYFWCLLLTEDTFSIPFVPVGLFNVTHGAFKSLSEDKKYFSTVFIGHRVDEVALASC